MFGAFSKDKHMSLDWQQLAAVFALMLVGAAFVFSATTNNDSSSDLPWYRQVYLKQIIWYAAGTFAAVVVCLFDYRTLARWSVVGYWGAILLLVLVLIPGIGSTHGWGARRWIDFGPFQMQPSEFAKIAFIFALGNFLSRPQEELRSVRLFWRSIGLTVLPFVLILLEPDLGSALVFIPVGLVMLYAAGTPVRFLANLVGAVGLLVVLLLVDVLFAPPGWYTIKLEDYQKRRLMVYFNMDYTRLAPPDASKPELLKLRQRQRDDSYQSRQALISIGSGGLLGKGWREGSQTALGFLPPGAAHNDFIFSVVAEEKGFVGSVIVITLYGVLLFSGIRIASQARDRLGRILAVGVVALLFSHVFINIGMNIRIMPVTGIPLPLLSYGGSSVVCSLIAIGILQSVHLHRRVY
jgi:rod shape determining protein RodA